MTPHPPEELDTLEAWPPTFPLFLLLQGRPCLILGGGAVARDKAAVLLSYGARIRVVATELHPELAQWVAQQTVSHVATAFHPDQLAGVWLVVNTLADPQLRQTVWQESERRCIFLNTVDVLDCCTAYWPSIVHRPPVTVAVGTGGVSPALAGYLRQKIAATLPATLLPLARWLNHWRKKITLQLPDLSQRSAVWQTLMKEGIVEGFLAGDIPEAEAAIRQTVKRMASAAPDKLPTNKNRA